MQRQAYSDVFEFEKETKPIVKAAVLTRRCSSLSDVPCELGLEIGHPGQVNLLRDETAIPLQGRRGKSHFGTRSEESPWQWSTETAEWFDA